MKKVMCIQHIESQYYLYIQFTFFYPESISLFRLLDTSYWLQKWKNIKQFILHLQLPEKEKYSSSFINSFLI